MLVLSRRPDEEIVLPTVPAVIEVISSQAGLVRLGIEAPADVPILREELTRDERGLREPENSRPRHELRNRLQNLTMALTRFRGNLPNAHPTVRETIDGIEKDVQAIRRHIASLASRGQGTSPAVEALV